MSELQKLAHAAWQCKYHVIWCPKYRFRILSGALQRSVGDLLQQLCEWKNLEIPANRFSKTFTNLQFQARTLSSDVPPALHLTQRFP